MGNYTETVATGARITNKDMSSITKETSLNMSWTSISSSITRTIWLNAGNAPLIGTTYTLNYNANGGEGAPDTQTIQSSSNSVTFNIPRTPIPTNDGYDFQGWSTSLTGTASYQPGGRFQTSNTSNTLYAVWATHTHTDEDDDGFCDKDEYCMHEKDTEGFCTVEGCTHSENCCPKKSHEHKDDNNDGFCDDDGDCMHEKDTEGFCTVEGCTHPDTCCLKKSHEHKDDNNDGFCDDDGACMHEKDAEGFCTVEGCTHPDTCCLKHTVEEATYTVEHYFEQTDGSYIIDGNATQIISSTPGAQVSAAALERSFYTVDSTHADSVSSGEVLADNTLVLKLYYKLNRVTLSYSANGGTNAPASQTSPVNPKSGSAQFTVSDVVPTRDGHKFMGWQMVDDETLYKAGDVLTLGGSVQLTAVWQSESPITYTLTYDAYGGTGAPAAQTAQSTTGSVDMVISKTVPTREGCTFIGWSTVYTGSAQYQPGDTITLTEDTTLYALWISGTIPPKTGDDSNIALWAGLATMSLLSAGAALVIFRKKFGSK